MKGPSKNNGILLVENDENDVFLLKRAFDNVGIISPLHVACDGREAIDFLLHERKEQTVLENGRTGLILLDLKMPGLDGFDFLNWRREQPVERLVPVVMLSSSALDQDIHRAYSLGINAFVTKPYRTSDRELLVRAIRDFWLLFVELPPP